MTEETFFVNNYIPYYPKKKKKTEKNFISEGIKSKREDIYIEKDIINEHFKLTQELINFKLENKSLFSSMHGRKKNKK